MGDFMDPTMDQKLTDLMDVIRKDQEDDNKTESSITANNNTNFQTLCTDVNDPYIQDIHQYPDLLIEQDGTEPLIGDPDLMFSSDYVSPLSISNNENDRKYSISEDFGQISFDQNNKNEELEEIKESSEAYIEPNNSVDIKYYPVQKRRQRSTKAELMRMSKKQKLEKKREGARNNTKNFYDRKKNGIKQMKENLEKAEKEFERMVNQKNDCEKNIATALGMIWDHIRYNPEGIRRCCETQKQEYKNAIKHIDDHFEVRELKEQVEEAQKKYKKAEADIALKLRNANTFGSKKCRAKNEKETAETNLKLKKMELAHTALTKHMDYFQSIQSKIREHFIHVRDQIGLQGMMSMEPNNKTVFENLLTFFDLENPL